MRDGFGKAVHEMDFERLCTSDGDPLGILLSYHVSHVQGQGVHMVGPQHGVSCVIPDIRWWGSCAAWSRVTPFWGIAASVI